jgi:hypothetical protein
MGMNAKKNPTNNAIAPIAVIAWVNSINKESGRNFRIHI